MHLRVHDLCREPGEEIQMHLMDLLLDRVSPKLSEADARKVETI